MFLKKIFFCKIFSKFFSKKYTVRFQKRKVFHPSPLDEHYGFCDLAIMGGRMVRGDENLSVFENRQFIFWKKYFEKILQKNFFQKHKIDFGGENKIVLEI